MTFLFLASHGLRTQLSAIRWACSRLKKSIGPLSREQRHLINEAYEHTLALTAALNAMLLVGRVEQRDYQPRSEIVDLGELLESARERAQARGIAWSMTVSDSMLVRADRAIVQTIVEMLAILSAEATGASTQVFVHVSPDGGSVLVSLHAYWQLPFLTVARSSSDAPSDQLLGGTTGLMLSLAQELARQVRGSVELQEVSSGQESMVSDGTVEMTESPDDYRILLRLPAA